MSTCKPLGTRHIGVDFGGPDWAAVVVIENGVIRSHLVRIPEMAITPKEAKARFADRLHKVLDELESVIDLRLAQGLFTTRIPVSDELGDSGLDVLIGRFTDSGWDVSADRSTSDKEASAFLTFMERAKPGKKGS